MEAVQPSAQLARDERRVLALAARGLSAREIAARLGWPEARVRSAQRGAITALGARSKLEALIIALRAGLIRIAAPDCEDPDD